MGQRGGWDWRGWEGGEKKGPATPTAESEPNCRRWRLQRKSIITQLGEKSSSGCIFNSFNLNPLHMWVFRQSDIAFMLPPPALLQCLGIKKSTAFKVRISSKKKQKTPRVVLSNETIIRLTSRNEAH